MKHRAGSGGKGSPPRAANAHPEDAADKLEIATLHVGGLHFASEKDVVERVLARRPGVDSVEANPVAQTATIRYDPGITSIAELRAWV